MSKQTVCEIIGCVIGAIAGLVMGAALGYLLFLQPAHGQEKSQYVTPLEYCNSMASLAESVAVARDAGRTRESVLQVVLENISNPQARMDATYTVIYSYTEPHMPPESDATVIFQLCWNANGE